MKMLKIAAIAGALTVAMTTQALADDKCKPSKWGADDEIGSANYVTPEQVLMASKLIKKGQSHPLGIVIDPTTPAFPPRSMSLQIVQPNQQGGQRLHGFGYAGSYNDDIAQLWFGIGPQIDGLGHLGEDGIYYNCNDEKDFAALTGLTKLGVHQIPPLVGRGVMIDMAKFFGVKTMEAGQAYTAEDIKAASKSQGVEIRKGDVVLFHTGWTDSKLKAEPTAWVSGEPGASNDAAVYLASLNVMAVGSDTWGVEAVPPLKGDKLFYGHVTLLKENGIYILETMNTGRLAAEEVHEFMFVLGQARIRGTVQMIINPVALW
ncbi:MAG: cyclase family protein [Sneathiella sp.]|nr:cyclase family protein [Sneathiella sp.]